MPTQVGPPPIPVTKTRAGLLIEARRTLVLSREELGRLLQRSKRTVGRMEIGQSAIDAEEFHQLARSVHPHDAALAEELARAGNTTLLDLGVVPSSPPVVMGPVVPSHLLVDAVVCAAADALNVAPESVRASVLAAFRRARELHMTLEDVENALTKQTKGP